MTELITIIGVILTVLCAIGASAYTSLISSRMLESSKKDELLSQAIDNLKAQTLQERVEAKVMEKESDVRIEMLRDAIQLEGGQAQEKEPSPQYATTADGQEINLQDYDIV